MKTKPNQRRSIHQIRKSVPAVTEDEISQFADSITTSNIPPINSETLFNMIYHILNKQSKNASDLLVLTFYLTHSPNLNSILEVSKDSISTDEMLRKISLFLKVEYAPKGKVICQNGHRGDKYYLILKGHVSILVPFPYKMRLTEEEYNNHLKALKTYKEFDLIRKTLDSNHYTHMTIESIEDLSEEAFLLAENREANKSEIVSIEEYTSRIIPLHVNHIEDYPFATNSNNNRRRKSSLNDIQQEAIDKAKEVYTFTLWQYRPVCEFRSKSAFGDIALRDENCKRTATVIALDNTFLGTLTRETYNLCIKDAQGKVRKQQVGNVLNNKLFEGFYPNIFEKHYFNFFKAVEYCLGDVLFSQGAPRREVFFLIEGEIELTTKTSLDNINGLIESLGGTIKAKPNIKQAERDSPDLVQYYQRIREFRLFIIKHQDVIGLDDCMIDSAYFCKASCKSQRCALYSIEIDLLNKIIENERRIRSNSENWLNKRKEMMIDRLLSIHDISLSLYCNTVKIENSLFSKRTESNSLSHSQKHSLPKLAIDKHHFLSRKKNKQHETMASNKSEYCKEQSQSSTINVNSNYYVVNTMSDAKTGFRPKNYKQLLPQINRNSSTPVKEPSIHLLFHREIFNKCNKTNKSIINNSNLEYYLTNEDIKQFNDNHSIIIPKRYQTIEYEQEHNLYLTERGVNDDNSHRKIVNDLMNKIVLGSSPSLLSNRNCCDPSNNSLSHSFSNYDPTVNNIDCLVVDKCIEKAEVQKEDRVIGLPPSKLIIKVRRRKIKKTNQTKPKKVLHI